MSTSMPDSVSPARRAARRLSAAVAALAIAIPGHAFAQAPMQIEAPPVLRASRILPKQMVAGPNHTVEERVVNDGYMNHYRIQSRFGLLEAQSTAELSIREREIDAIARMKEVDTSGELVEGVGASANRLVSGTGDLLADPVGGVSNALSGVGRLFGRATSTVAGTDKGGHDDLLGFDKAKRQIAAEFSVDVYSTNPLLQAELDRLAGAKNMGGLALSGALMPIGGAAGLAISATSATVKLDEMMRDKSVAQLRELNAGRLAAMGVNRDVADLFLDVPALSPLHQSAIVDALDSMRGAEGRGLVIKQAVLTDSEDVALFRTRQIAMYVLHHERAAPIKRFVSAGKYVVAAVDANENMIVALPTDYLAWTQNVANITVGARETLRTIAGVRSRSIVTTGSVSQLARTSLESIGWTVNDGFELKFN